LRSFLAQRINQPFKHNSFCSLSFNSGNIDKIIVRAKIIKSFSDTVKPPAVPSRKMGLELKGNGGPSGEAFHIQNNLFIASAFFSNYLFVAT